MRASLTRTTCTTLDATPGEMVITRVAGRTALDMEKVSSSGPMETVSKESFQTIRNLVRKKKKKKKKGV